jgi:hypothetical protein
MNCPDFELLSAHADGETTPAEAALVDQHRAGCNLCSQQLANLGFVSRAVRQPQALPPGFKIKVRPRPKTGWWQKLRELADSPVVHLVSAQRRRRARFGLREMAKIMAIFALPVFFMSISSDRSPLLAFVAISALGLMIGLPLRQFSEEVALLASLRRGRCLEEIVGTGTSAQGLLDGLAVQGLGQIGRAALTVWPVLLAGTLGVPNYWRQQTLRLEVAWLPCLLAFFLAGYYLAQLVNVWKGSWLRRLAMFLLALCPWTLALLGLPGCLAASLLTAVVARQLAIHELENPALVRAVPVHRRNPLVRTWSQNPITRREMSRLASGMSGHWSRLLAWRASMALLPLAWTLTTLDKPLDQWPEVFSPGVLFFAALFFVRSALLTLPSVVREREQQSWEILMQTPLGPQTVVHGWLQVCIYQVATEGVFALLVLAGYLFAAAPWTQWGWPLASLLLLPLAALSGAYLGLALSASSRNQREAGQRLILWCLSAVLGWLMAWGIGQGLRATVWAPVVAFRDNPPPFYWMGPVALLALLPVGVLLTLQARPLLRKLPFIDPSEHEQVQSRYSPILTWLDLGSLLVLGYGLVAWDLLAKQVDLSAFKGATLLLAVGLVWILGLRLPLATLAELSLGRRFSYLLSILFGLWLGWAGYLALQTISFKLHEPWLLTLESEFACTFFGLFIGVVSGALAAHAPPGTPARRAHLRPRLFRSGLLCVATVLAMFAMKSHLEISPKSPPKSRSFSGLTLTTVYRSQLERTREICFSDNEMFLRNEKWDEYPSSESPADWERFATRHANRPAMQRLRQRLPEFGEAAPVAGEVPGNPRYWNRSLRCILRAQSILYERSANFKAALNCERWALLYLDSQQHWQSDRTLEIVNESEISWILASLQSKILDGLADRALIDQLLNHEMDSAWLVYSYCFLADQPMDQPELLPKFYLDRENLARVRSVQQAQTFARDFKLWELSHDNGAELLQGIRFTPMARRLVYQCTLSNGVEGLARSWSRREGLALLAAIQLYRRDHAQAWPDDLEQVQSYLPRPARCYLNQSGSFDYAPGVLSCSRDDGSERIVIYQEGKR